MIDRHRCAHKQPILDIVKNSLSSTGAHCKGLLTFSKFLLIALLQRRSLLYWITSSPLLTTPSLQILNSSLSTFDHQLHPTRLLHHSVPLLIYLPYLINNPRPIPPIQDLFLLSSQINLVMKILVLVILLIPKLYLIYHEPNLYIFHLHLHLLLQLLIYLVFPQLLHLLYHLPCLIYLPFSTIE